MKGLARRVCYYRWDAMVDDIKQVYPEESARCIQHQIEQLDNIKVVPVERKGAQADACSADEVVPSLGGCSTLGW